MYVKLANTFYVRVSVLVRGDAPLGRVFQIVRLGEIVVINELNGIELN